MIPHTQIKPCLGGKMHHIFLWPMAILRFKKIERKYTNTQAFNVSQDNYIVSKWYKILNLQACR